MKKPVHRAAKAESWEFKILPYSDKQPELVEHAPHNEHTRAIFQLRKPIRDWLKEHKHKLTIDRGDWGEGDEHFYVKVFSKGDATDFAHLVDDLRKAGK